MNNLQSIVAAGKESNRRNRKRRAQENRLAQYSLWFSLLFIPDFIQKDETHFFNFLEKTLQSQESIVLKLIIYLTMNFTFLESAAFDVAKKSPATKSTGQNLNVEVIICCLLSVCSSDYYILCSSYLN